MGGLAQGGGIYLRPSYLALGLWWQDAVGRCMEARIELTVHFLHDVP